MAAGKEGLVYGTEPGMYSRAALVAYVGFYCAGNPTGFVGRGIVKLTHKLIRNLPDEETR